jgi:hypothetical protein
MDRATTRELRRTDRPLTSPTGALLAVRLPATTAHFSTGLGVVRTLTRGCELRDHHLVNQGNVDLDIEELARQLH